MDTSARLLYFEDHPTYKTEKPFRASNSPGSPTTSNLRWKLGDEELICDARGQEGSFSLDNNGFRYVISPTGFRRWEDRQSVSSIYLEEMKELLKREVEGADVIRIFDWKVRDSRHYERT